VLEAVAEVVGVADAAVVAAEEDELVVVWEEQPSHASAKRGRARDRTRRG